MNIFKNQFAYAAYSLGIGILIIALQYYLNLHGLFRVVAIPFIVYSVLFVLIATVYAWIINPIKAWRKGNKGEVYSALAGIGVFVFIILILLFISYVNRW